VVEVQRWRGRGERFFVADGLAATDSQLHPFLHFHPPGVSALVGALRLSGCSKTRFGVFCIALMTDKVDVALPVSE